MIRAVKFVISHANLAKQQYLYEVMVEFNRIVNVLARFLAESSQQNDTNPLSMKRKKGGSMYKL